MHELSEIVDIEIKDLKPFIFLLLVQEGVKYEE